MRKQLIADLAWGVGIVALALVATLARNLGYIDADTVTRLVLGATGLMVAWFGNRMPKTIAPSARATELGAAYCRARWGPDRRGAGHRSPHGRSRRRVSRGRYERTRCRSWPVPAAAP